MIKKKYHYFVKWLEELVLYLMSVVGVRGVSISYLCRIKEELECRDNPSALISGIPHCAELGSVENELIQ